MGPAGDGRMSREQMDEYFTSAGSGDSEIFARQFISNNYIEEGGLAELFYGTALRGEHCKNFIQTFERLRKLAQNCDIDGIIEGSLMHSAFGLLYVRMLEHRPGD